MKSLIILREVTIEKMCEIMGSKDELNADDISNAVFNLVQSIVNALQGEDKKQIRTHENELVAGIYK